jgi:hypothetical protein
MGPDGRILQPGRVGEVVVRSAHTFTGYENDPAENARCFLDGWFRTGDEGYLDEEGYLTLTGRIKDIINRGGEKITPSEVDAALMAHPDVATAVTFPIPHTTLGQEVAAVVPEKGAELTDETLTHFLRGKLAPFKVPRRFIMVEDIPKGASGKIQRRNLADAFGLVTDSVAGQRERIADDRPATALEAKLKRIWAEVLELDRVGLYEDFFYARRRFPAGGGPVPAGRKGDRPTPPALGPVRGRDRGEDGAPDQGVHPVTVPRPVTA